MRMYNDSYNDAKKNIMKSDKNRASYYQMISNKTWGSVENYDLCINSTLDKEKIADIIIEYVKQRDKK